MTPSKTSKLDLFNFGTQEQPQEITQAPTPAAPSEAPKRKKHSPVSVYLPEEQVRIIETIAKATGQTRHAVLQYAVRRVCDEWGRGIYPEMEVKPKFK